MANAKKCDRCGVFYEKNVDYPVNTNGIKTVINGMCMTTKIGHTRQETDLCDTCLGKLNLFLSGVELDWKKEE